MRALPVACRNKMAFEGRDIPKGDLEETPAFTQVGDDIQ
jgi:hypothetical protein